MAPHTAGRSPSPTPSRLPPVPASPTYSYASTANPIPSSFNLPPPPAPRSPHAVLSKSDLELSETAYSDLLSSAKAYRSALAELSSSASSFGSALESCARLKEARSEALNPPGGSLSNSFTAKGTCTADSLLAASGVHQLIANHQQILSECVYRNFEVPLLHELDQWRRHLEEEKVTYQKGAAAMNKEIRRMEKEGLKLQKQRQRDAGKFREHLVDLTGKLDGFTLLHWDHARSLLRDSQETSYKIVEASSSLVRAEMDIFEALARKGWSGGGLDDLLERGKDLFANDAEGHANSHDHSKIFSILPQKSILADASHDGSARSVGNHMRSDSLLVDGERYQSLAGAVSGRDPDTGSIFSERDVGILNRSRGVRPFSPPPMERVRDPLELPLGSGDIDHESAKTMIQVTAPPTEDAANPEASPSIDENNGDRGRERRWSVTDDGVVSD
ncbi:hypothetical protein B7494_g6151 [Chlorociboria aeruginascens]|nr:hypothetical protein B7494_g6151 [Chlorociboria aeruginascens]